MINLRCDDMRYYGRIVAKEYAGIEPKDGQENGWLVHTANTIWLDYPGYHYWGWSPQPLDDANAPAITQVHQG